MTAANQSTLAAYERWAPSYQATPHNPLMRAEQEAMLAQWPSVAGKRALDLACGSGRYARLLAETGATAVTAVDFSARMLQRVSGCARVQASMMSLPFVNGAFDIVVSGLAVGHASNIERWMTEAARVLASSGVLLYSDFHPQAARAGLERSFKDENGALCAVPHNIYDVSMQAEAAAAAGLIVESTTELRAGMEIVEPFTGSEEFYQRWRGLPLVLIVRARRR